MKILNDLKEMITEIALIIKELEKHQKIAMLLFWLSLCVPISIIVTKLATVQGNVEWKLFLTCNMIGLTFLVTLLFAKILQIPKFEREYDLYDVISDMICLSCVIAISSIIFLAVRVAIVELINNGYIVHMLLFTVFIIASTIAAVYSRRQQ